MISDLQALLANFHFLRPVWLLLIPVILFVIWYVVKRHRAAGWQSQLSADAVAHLTVSATTRSKTRIACLTLPLFLGAVGLAGPSWQLLPETAASNRHAVVYVLDLSPSMLAKDVTPNRIALARLKLTDLLELRRDGESALIVYAGDAHRVTPLSDDPATIKAILPTLDPAIMPVPGSRAEAAIALALTVLSDAGHTQGDILMLTDGVHPTAIESIKTNLPASIRLSILGIGGVAGATIPDGNNGVVVDNTGTVVVAKLNETELKLLTHHTNGLFAAMTTDSSDINNLLRHIGKPMQSELIRTTLNYDQWHDAGYWLVLALLPFAALSFTRQWLWSAIPLAISVSFLSLSLPTTSRAAEWSDLWMNEDQQAMRLLQSGDAKNAATLFRNSRWSAVALYRAQQYQQLVDSFIPNSAEDFFLLGNAYAMLSRFDNAISAYKKTLILNAATVNQLAEDARYNISLLQNNPDDEQADNTTPENEPTTGEDSGEKNEASEQTEEQAAGETEGDSATQPQLGGAVGGRDSLDQSTLKDQGAPGDAIKNTSNEPAARDASNTEDSIESNRASENTEDQNNSPDSNPEIQFEENSNTVLNPYAEQWLRTLPQDPGGYFRRKLSYQSQLRQKAQGGSITPLKSQRY